MATTVESRRRHQAFGWTRANYWLRLRTGHFPEPDGIEGAHRWWWPETTNAWTSRQNLHSCPDCGALVQRLQQHRVRHRRAD
jgi:hypothetical protein